MIYERGLMLECLVFVRGSARTDILRVAKALALSEPMAIFHAGHGKSWLVDSTTLAEYGRIRQVTWVHQVPPNSTAAFHRFPPVPWRGQSTAICGNLGQFAYANYLTTLLANYPIILRINWLKQHNPTINWKKREITFNSKYCRETCLGYSLAASIYSLGY